MTEIYRDLDLSLEKTNQNDFNILTNRDCISQSIRNLVYPKKSTYNRFQLSDIGTNIESLLGEKISKFVSLQIKDEVEFAIKNYEPRIKLLSVESGLSNNNNGYVLEINYEIKRIRLNDILIINMNVII